MRVVSPVTSFPKPGRSIPQRLIRDHDRGLTLPSQTPLAMIFQCVNTRRSSHPPQSRSKPRSEHDTESSKRTPNDRLRKMFVLRNPDFGSALRDVTENVVFGRRSRVNGNEIIRW
jgi:hypothetical protein